MSLTNEICIECKKPIPKNAIFCPDCGKKQSKKRLTLQQRIEQDIQKSGFPLEITIANELEKMGWNLTIHDYYVDSKTNESREIDIIATKAYGIKSQWLSSFDFLFPYLIVECKKRTKPWLFYTGSSILSMDTANLDLDNLPYPTTNFLEKFFRASRKIHYSAPVSTIGYESFNDSKKGDEIFSSCLQVVKALIYGKKRSSIEKERKPLIEFYPIIVLDGQLYEYKKDGKIAEVPHIVYRLRFNLSEDIYNKESSFWIDIVKKEFFSDYLQRLDHEFDNKASGKIFDILKTT